MRTIIWAALTAAAAAACAAETTSGQQRVFGSGNGGFAGSSVRHGDGSQSFMTSYLDDPDHPDSDPLEHSSGISPYHDAPGADIRPPKGCEVTAAAFLIRHSCIHANDDEWEEYMQPFAERVYTSRGAFPTDGPLAFLNQWSSPITLENAEEITQFGKEDAHRLGKRFRRLYPHLLPPKHLGRRKKHKGGKLLDDDVEAEKVKTPFKVWTASSTRDIDTAKSFIRGAFPKSQEGRRGEGDGKYLSLVEVPNKDANWGASLTPHKICPRFTKEEGRADAKVFLQNWGPGPLQKLRNLAPDFDFQLKDVIAVFMLCGYETIINGKKRSKFCSADIFDPEDWKNFEYFFDVLYHKMIGYGSPVGPQLGIHWVNTSMHNLMAAIDGDEEHASTVLSRKDPHLPDPGAPPNGTHTQRLFAYFTHREEPGVALTALGLWNQTKVGPLPLTHRVDDRVWMTSHVLPFLGHVALERISCKHDRKNSYIRAVVNGAVQHFDDCQSGPGGSCPMPEFAQYVAQRVEQYGDFAAACRVDEEPK